MLRYLFTLSLAFFLAGCNSNKSCTTCRYFDDGSAKPTVVLVPMLDSTSYDAPWSLSEEFSSQIKTALETNDALYFPLDLNLNTNCKENPFGQDLRWMKNSFKGADFVVFMELVEHEDVPLIKTVKDPKAVSEFRRNASNLNMAMRVRIVDVRKAEPAIVLQEMLKDSYYTANTIEKTDYNQITWGSEHYKNTPMGIAHSEFAKMIEERINDYIQLAKTR
ncbi:MAG: CT253 family lipoprotein [Parachlamydiales bacterium]|jgi:hypothetical protein